VPQANFKGHVLELDIHVPVYHDVIYANDQQYAAV